MTNAMHTGLKHLIYFSLLISQFGFCKSDDTDSEKKINSQISRIVFIAVYKESLSRECLAFIGEESNVKIYRQYVSNEKNKGMQLVVITKNEVLHQSVENMNVVIDVTKTSPFNALHGLTVAEILAKRLKLIQ